MKIAVNTRTTGKVREENINGRPHLVTSMMPIRGDISMNGIYYPDAQVTESFNQLDMMPAPLGHPTINGMYASANHPLSTNAHNVGGFVRTPRKKGKRVICDFCLDVSVAERTDDGKVLKEKMMNSEKIGVSTGLSITKVTNKEGNDDFGKPYSRIGEGYVFDHVAILLNEVAAGEHAGTELILNQGTDDEIFVYNLQINELSMGDIHDQLRGLVRKVDDKDGFVWIKEVFPEGKSFVYSTENKDGLDQLYKQSYTITENEEIQLVNDRIEVVQKTEFIQKQTINIAQVVDMNKELLIMAIIANSANPYTMADKSKLEAMDETTLINSVCTPITEESARNALLDSGFDFDGHDVFLANKEHFTAFMASRKEKRDTLIGEIVANTEYTPDMLEGKDDKELSILSKTIGKTVDRLAAGTTNSKNTTQAVTACNYS